MAGVAIMFALSDRKCTAEINQGKKTETRMALNYDKYVSRGILTVILVI